jgi:uncharacterized protein YbcC (UPF0753/DUF2309 family)
VAHALNLPKLDLLKILARFIRKDAMTAIIEMPAVSLDDPEFAIAPRESLASQVENACKRIPPLWPLKNFVAVNPFLGLADHSFVEAAALMRRVTHSDILMPADYYREQAKAGRITDADLRQALVQAAPAENITLEALKSWLDSDSPASAEIAIPTVSEVVDELHGTQWNAFIVDEVSKWCSAFYDEGQASWRMPWRGEPLFWAWKQAALCDANPEMMGLRGFRQLVDSLPDDALATIKQILDALAVPQAGITDFLHRQLMSIGGWSAYAQYQVREMGMRGHRDDTLQHLLAIRLAYELALLNQYGGAQLEEIWAARMASLQKASLQQESAPEVPLAYVWQLAAENAYQRQLIAQLTEADSVLGDDKPAARAALQAIFCIDVRSEVYRRSLEAAAPGIETIGFAGFFGFPIEYVPFGQRHGAAQCPVLLTPKFRIREGVPQASYQEVETLLHRKMFSKRLGRSWNSFKTSAVSCFSFVETGGLLSGIKLVKDSLGLHGADEKPSALAPCVNHDAPVENAVRKGHDHKHLHEGGMSAEEQIAVAFGALKNMGLTGNFARLVMVCGHGSSTTNNPYGSGLDCGACGGHSGEANARVAATVLNNPTVRAGLQAQGVLIPEDTWFMAALHNTTTDDVTLFDRASVPATHEQDMKNLREWLSAASQRTRLQRATSLGIEGAAEKEIHDLVRARSHDWAQTRPEWGLAGNAAFIAAPRERTKSLNLGGRAFLHNYDFRNDGDGSILELIMTAPMVVASWINLQYFASTVNNSQFGSGNKVIHNVVGTFGVWQGNGGDLQVGLPMQSVHNGRKWMHEPLRLSVFIEAPRHQIDQVIENHESVRNLLDHGWLHLIAIEDEGKRFARYCGDLHWKSIDAIGAE